MLGVREGNSHIGKGEGPVVWSDCGKSIPNECDPTGKRLVALVLGVYCTVLGTHTIKIQSMI